jgi:putative transposase
MGKKKHPFSNEFLDSLIDGRSTQEDFFGPKGLFKQLQAALAERMLQGEMTHQLGYEPHGDAESQGSNRRNGSFEKTVETETGPLSFEVPRDREGAFEPQLVKKGQRRLEGFDEKVISLYSRGHSSGNQAMREIQGHLEDLYGTAVSPELISKVTDMVMEDVRAWQSRPLESHYPIVYLDALHVKMREAGHICNRAVYLAIGVTMTGEKQPLGLWTSKNQGAKFWLQVVTELKNRGVEDIFIACVDGLRGFPEAINAVFPKTQVQLCIVHMIRHSLRFVSWKERKNVTRGLKAIYGAPSVEAAEEALMAFREKWDDTYPAIADSWQRNRDNIVPFLAYHPMIRKVIYTTNAIEAANRQIRKVIKTKGAFPNEQAAIKTIYLALIKAQKKWKMPISDWKAAMNQFAIIVGDRFPKAGV